MYKVVTYVDLLFYHKQLFQHRLVSLLLTKSNPAFLLTIIYIDIQLIIRINRNAFVFNTISIMSQQYER